MQKQACVQTLSLDVSLLPPAVLFENNKCRVLKKAGAAV